MSLFVRALRPSLRLSSMNGHLICTRKVATEANEEPARNVQKPIYTSVTSPLEQKHHDIGLFYKVSPDVYETVYEQPSKSSHTRLLKAFEEYSFLIRPQGAMLCSLLQRYMRDCDYAWSSSRKLVPQVRFVCHGRRGDGITSVLAYVVHAAWLTRRFLITTWYWPHKYVRYSPDILVSDHHDDRFDLPTFGVQWLGQFLKLNRHLIQEKKLVTTKDVIWNAKESLNAGASWLEVVEYGMLRPKYSNDCIGILLREMESLPPRCAEGESPLLRMTVMDGINSIWSDKTRLHDPRTHVALTSKQLSLMHFMRRQVQHSGTDVNAGTFLLGSTNTKASWSDHRESNLPKYLLKDEGFQALDPFVPLEVTPISRKNGETVLKYFLEKNWLANRLAKNPYSIAWKEMLFMADGNIEELFDLSGEW